MPQTRILPRSSGLAMLGTQDYKEHSLWQNRAYRAPGTIVTATPPSPSKSQLPDAMKALPSGVKVIFCTCFPIAARAIRGSEVSNLRKSRCRTSTNLRVSRMHDLTASGSMEHSQGKK